jgi:hypothetical protein
LPKLFFAIFFKRRVNKFMYVRNPSSHGKERARRSLVWPKFASLPPFPCWQAPKDFGRTRTQGPPGIYDGILVEEEVILELDKLWFWVSTDSSKRYFGKEPPVPTRSAMQCNADFRDASALNPRKPPVVSGPCISNSPLQSSPSSPSAPSSS